MNSSVTIRLPGLAIPTKDSQRLTAPAAAAVIDCAVSDEALMAQICEGSTEALALLFRRYARVVHTVSYRVVRDSCEADDLVQDVFLRVHRDCAMFDTSKGTARSWILQVAYHCAISRRRYLTSRHFYTGLELDDAANQLVDSRMSTGQVEDSIDGRFGSGRLQRVFEELSENQRRTLKLFFVEGYTLDEIATELGQSRGNVKHHYFRGLDRLRKELFGRELPAKEQHDKRVLPTEE